MTAYDCHYLKLGDQLNRAYEARADAQRARDPFRKRILLQIAQSYENLATRAAKRGPNAGDWPERPQPFGLRALVDAQS